MPEKLERSREDALRIARAADYAVLSYIDAATGAPHGVPVSPVVTPEGVVFWHCTNGPSTRNAGVEADPRVSLTFVARCEDLAQKYSNNYASAVLKGRARRIDDPDEKREAALLICVRHAGGVERMKRHAAYYEVDNAGMCVWRLDPEEVTGRARRWDLAVKEFEARGF